MRPAAPARANEASPASGISPAFRHHATSAYSSPCDPIAKTRSPPRSQTSRPASARVSASITSSATIAAPRAISLSRAASASPRFMETQSTSPTGRLVCRPRWIRTSASSIGVTGCRDMPGCRSSR